MTLNPTVEQLNARLTPQATNVNLPSEGLFTGLSGLGEGLYRRVGNKIESVGDIVNMLVPEAERTQYGNYGGLTNEAIKRLQSQYGINVNKLSKFNLADLQGGTAYKAGLQAFNDRTGQYIHNYSGDLAGFLGTPATTGSQQVGINTGFNALPTTAQLSAADVATKQQLTGQSIEDGIKNLGIPQTNLQPGMTGDEVKKLQDYLVKEGYMTQAQVNTGYGIYGPQTTKAVEALQKAKGVNAGANAGYFGPQTRSALTRTSQDEVGTNINGDTLQDEKQTDIGSVFPTFDGDDAGAAVASATTAKQWIDDWMKLNEPPKDAKLESAEDILKSLYEQTGNQGADQAAAEKAQQVQEKKVALTAIKGKIASLEAQFNAYSVDQEGKPITMASIQGSIAAKRNLIAAEMTMLTAQASFLTDQYNDALEAANHAVDLKYQDLERKIRIQEALVGMYSNDKNAKDSLRSQAVTAYLAEQKEKAAELKQSEKDMKAFAIDAANSYRDAGIKITDDYDTVNRKVQNSKSYQAEQAKKVEGVGGGSGTSPVLTPEQKADPFVQLLLSTAGGKPITDTFAQSLNKGLNVLGQIGSLQTNIQNTDTGPIVGAFRGANPWDTNAQTIKAQLNAIVPNLARGIYGEVGVLTDNDIAQYSKTLPNLKSTEDIRNAVLGITVDLIGKSIKRTLEINAANQKDVSGFVNIYTDMVATRDSIFAQIPGYKGVGGTETPQDNLSNLSDDDLEAQIAGEMTQNQGYFSNLWNAIKGN